MKTKTHITVLGRVKVKPITFEDRIDNFVLDETKPFGLRYLVNAIYAVWYVIILNK